MSNLLSLLNCMNILLFLEKNEKVANFSPYIFNQYFGHCCSLIPSNVVLHKTLLSSLITKKDRSSAVCVIVILLSVALNET